MRFSEPRASSEKHNCSSSKGHICRSLRTVTPILPVADHQEVRGRPPSKPHVKSWGKLTQETTYDNHLLCYEKRAAPSSENLADPVRRSVCRSGPVTPTARSASESSAGMLLELEILDMDTRLNAVPPRCEASGAPAAAVDMARATDALLRSFTALRKAPTRGAAPVSGWMPLVLPLNKVPARADDSDTSDTNELCRCRPRGKGRLRGRGVPPLVSRWSLGLADAESGSLWLSSSDAMACEGRGFGSFEFSGTCSCTAVHAAACQGCKAPQKLSPQVLNGRMPLARLPAEKGARKISTVVLLAFSGASSSLQIFAWIGLIYCSNIYCRTISSTWLA